MRRLRLAEEEKEDEEDRDDLTPGDENENENYETGISPPRNSLVISIYLIDYVCRT